MKAEAGLTLGTLVLTLIIALVIVAITPFTAELGIASEQLQAAEEEEKQQKTRRVPIDCARRQLPS